MNDLFELISSFGIVHLKLDLLRVKYIRGDISQPPLMVPKTSNAESQVKCHASLMYYSNTENCSISAKYIGRMSQEPEGGGFQDDVYVVSIVYFALSKAFLL